MATGTVTTQAENYLRALVEDLAIGEARYEQAERSYQSLAEWLSRPESTLLRYSPQVYVQGSFRLGTVIRPPSEAEDYDVDAVCELRSLGTRSLSQQELKQRLETEVRSYHHSKSMTKPVREGRRCWVLDYADGAQFHMDIVPCVPNAERMRLLLESRGETSPWSGTAVAITDNERSNYPVVHEDWCRSNPKGYAGWFRQRMIVALTRRKQNLAESTRSPVESIPDYRVRTPLQSAIMLLKRHRDLRFEGRVKDRPISIILSTLAAHAYAAEESIGDALMSILTGMDRFIEFEDGEYVIRNPTDPLENFADKWKEFPERAVAFRDWLKQARTDFSEAAALSDTRMIAESVAPSLGHPLAERAMRKVGATLLRSSSAAPAAAAALAFPNAPRVPTKPQGFA